MKPHDVSRSPGLRRRKSTWVALGLLIACAATYFGFVVWLYGSDDVDMARATTDSFRPVKQATVTPLRGNTYLLTGGGLNVTALVTSDGVVLVDTATSWAAPKMEKALRTITDLPVRYIINTHAHTDHRGGNAYFARDGAEIIAQALTAQKMKEPPLSGATPEDQPTFVFGAMHHFDFGGETIEITHVPDAHTQGDVVVRFVAADVFVAGDILINEGFPFVAEAVGASVDGYLRAQSQIIPMVGDQTIVIAGHGPVANKARLKDVHDRLSRIRHTVAFWKGLGLSSRAMLVFYPTYAWPFSWNRLGMSPKFFVQMTYRSVPG